LACEADGVQRWIAGAVTATVGNEAVERIHRMCSPGRPFTSLRAADAQSLLRATEIANAANPSVNNQPPRRPVAAGAARTVKLRSSPRDGIFASTSDGSSCQRAQKLRTCSVACRCNNE